MRRLIYFVSRGQAYHDMLSVCIESLMPNIDDSYDVIVFSDSLFQAERVRNIIPETVPSRFELIKYLKGSDIDIYDYDLIYYFDSDIIFRKHLNELTVSDTKITLCREFRSKMTDYHVNLLQTEARWVNEELSINNGSFVVPVKYVYHFFQVLKKYIKWYKNEINNSYIHFFAAQSAFNKLHANKVFKFAFFDPEQVHWPSDSEGESVITDKTVFSHYAGMTMEARMIEMKNLLKHG